jgi:hydroxyethylthiazole kinase
VREITWADPDVRRELSQLKKVAPFVYGLTNYIAANLSANVLLAVGAGPAIGAAPGWPTAFAAGAAGLWINSAALMSSGADTLLEASRSADAAGTPWVLDPVAVGAGAAEYDEIVRSLLAFRPTVIRGNASELIALAGGAGGSKGVETTAKASDAIEFIKDLATSTGSIVAVSGPIDYISDGSEVYAVPGGDIRLTKVTGAGCSLGALIAAVVAASDSPLRATYAAHAIYAVAAERAAAQTKGTASFATALVDQLSLLDPDEMPVA